jgi:hypothetical protein
MAANGELAELNIELWLARVQSEVVAFLRRAELEQTIDPDRFYLVVHAGVDACFERFG